MPELPEVETVCRGLQQQLVGDTISSVEVLRRDSIAYPSVEEFCQALPGHQFKRVHRRGKYILIDLDREAGLVVHLRMSGRLIVRERDSGRDESEARARDRAGKDSPGRRDSGRAQDKIKAKAGVTVKEGFLRVFLRLASGRVVHYEDMRVFGRLWYKPSSMTFESVVPALAELGVEPLEGLELDSIKALLENKKQPIKSALLDQRLIAGIGNIYADESLFRAGIHPQRAAGSLSKAELERLLIEIPLVLKKAIKFRGSTLSDYTDSQGVNGNYQNKAWVYGRDGEKCRVCRSVIERVKLSGRSSHFCPLCQRLKRAGSKVRGRST